MPRTSRDGQERAERDEAGPDRPRRRCVSRRSPGEDERGPANGEEEREADDPGVGEDLDVEVLDAPAILARRKRKVDDVREALARIRHDKLEHVRARRALPPDAGDGVVLEDAQPDVGEHRALREVSTPTGGSSPRTPTKRRKSSSASPRTAATPPATASTTAASAMSCRAGGANRAREAIATASIPTASPPTAATDPASTSPRRPATSAGTKSDDTGRFLRDATIPAAATLSAIAESAARSWCPRNDGSRQPALHASKIPTPKNWRRATAVAATPERTRAPRKITRSSRRRTSSGTTTARSAYSQSLANVTK